MVEAENATSDETKSDGKALAKIEPVKIELPLQMQNAHPQILKMRKLTAGLELEKSLISATILLLREHGIRKSGAAVRDAVDISHQYIGPKEAVSSYLVWVSKQVLVV